MYGEYITSSAFVGRSLTGGGGLLVVGALVNKLSSSSLPNPNGSLLVVVVIGLAASVD